MYGLIESRAAIFTTALSVSRVLPLWRPSALDLDFLLLLSLSLSHTLLRAADWRVSPQLARVTVGLVVFVHISFFFPCVCEIEEQQVFFNPLRRRILKEQEAAER